MSSTDTSQGNIDFIITKASLGKDGVMRWSATVSKFAVDEQKDEVTKEFYENAIARVEKGEYPMPALVVSHYDDPRVSSIGQPVPDVFKAGETTAMYIDRNQPKAKGYFLDNALGKAVFDAVKNDIAGDVPHSERARISMSFRPEPEGIEKADNGVLRYNDGHIRHFAVTRVPIVKETSIVTDNVEKSEARKTRYEDASSIIGSDLAANLDKEYNSLSRFKSEEPEAAPLLEKAATEKMDMGSCITEAMNAGKSRKQAIAYCLSVSGKDKADNGGESVTLMDLFDHDSCIQQYINQGWSAAAAKAFCDVQAIKMAKMPYPQMSMEGMGAMSKSETTAEVEEKKEEETKESTQAPEKGDLDTLMDATISDDEVKVVKSDSETAPASEETEENVEKMKKPVNQKKEATDSSEKESESMDDSYMEEKEGKSQKKKSEVETDVNGEEPKKEIAPVSKSRADILDEMYKAVLVDTSMDRGQKVAAINMILKEKGEIAQESIKQTEPSAQDQAALMKAAIEEVVQPLLMEVQKLRADNEQLKAVAKGGFFDAVMGTQKPQPKGLTPQPVQKSQTDNGGAQTAEQIAASTVRYSNIG